ncbi:UvrA1 [Desulforapulum autotrophicum HRM2]|uniref:UvrABC system protein A n=1 Tax=Desulforapulum autotrophicum (strain ATCC 43914 / DSM 3382 / VKM B-1955 / HRM2) TaxID=177437 RepID=C0QKD9_DESAH|nr:excinuclease ABC subunit UvrA [Desulforapulum autotrophicum]ACN14010.1 UvrA1 [Desulforapulum autotrophicum HRM2]
MKNGQSAIKSIIRDIKPGKTMELDTIIVKGAREHNLKNIDVTIPKKQLIVFTGVSGSGKSSLAFDTIFAEGQRRYVESLSSYARQFIGQMEKPKYDTIRGLSPTIAIEQKSASKNPRSTVGTITEIYDYLRVLFARVGTQYCFKCGKKVGQGNAESMVSQILALPLDSKILVMAPIVENRKGEHRDRLGDLKQEGFARVRINDVVQDLADVQTLPKNKKHNIEVVVDRLVIKKDPAFTKRLTDSVETALKLGNGRLFIHIPGREDLKMSEARSCCGMAYPELVPQLFSFNSPLGMCSECNGIGTLLSMDVNKVVADPSLTIRQGAVIPWKNYFLKNPRYTNSSWGKEQLLAMEEQWDLDYDTPWKDLPRAQKDLILYGSKGKELTVNWNSAKIQGAVTMSHEGVLNTLMRRYRSTQSEGSKRYYSGFMTSKPCPVCQGRRLKEEVLHVLINGRSIIDLTEMTIQDAYEFISNLKLEGNQLLIAEELLKEIQDRLGFLVNVGLDYLSLDRNGPTLSGGESQRIRLASQIGSELTGVLYILDEPSIGLHQRDNGKLLKTLHHLRDIGNTLIVVEHDQETMENSDWIVDIGPGAGHLGGQIVAQGTPDQIRQDPMSITGRFLNMTETIEIPEQRRTPKQMGNHFITIKGATENNLKNVTAKIPLGLVVAVTGVSGAGKSTLINQILYPALAVTLNNATLEVGRHKTITGLENLDKIINIDQKPIGRTPRSNPATYTKVFDPIRELFASLPEAKVRGYQKGRFSFNVKGGRCEACHGDGYIKVEMHFLADVFVPCEVCHGKRFNTATLEIKYKDHSIADVLDLSVVQAMVLFKNHPKIRTILTTLMDVGLTYIKLGQAATTLSGGEAQRIKLARELAKRDTGKTLYILDEPTTGLHFQDVKLLLKVLQRLSLAGNTVIIIEHNLDVIKTADWVIDLGPEGGHRGGEIIAQGSPEQVARSKKSYTGFFLKKMLA